MRPLLLTFVAHSGHATYARFTGHLPATVY
jgi:hypothetical protein